MLCLDMGLGKTLIALTLIKHLNKRALVLAPKNVALNTWGNEIDKHLPNQLTYEVCVGPNFKKIYNTINKIS